MPALINAVKTKGTDEWYTAAKDVEMILPYLSKGSTVWCPFDTTDSHYVKVLKSSGINVVHGHITEGKDFFKYEPEHYDAIISNPPFSLFNEILERVYKLNKPFALVCNISSIFDGKFGFGLLKEHDDIQLFIPQKRMKFFNDCKDENTKCSPAYKSIYMCRNLLPKQICFE